MEGKIKKLIKLVEQLEKLTIKLISLVDWLEFPIYTLKHLLQDRGVKIKILLPYKNNNKNIFHRQYEKNGFKIS